MISDLQMAGLSEKETPIMVAETIEVIREHCQKLETMTIATRAAQERLATNHPSPAL